MAPKLRSTPRARPSQSGPATPLNATAAVNSASSFTESTRPRKQRRTGRHSRVATDPLQDTESPNHSQVGQRGAGIDDTASDSQPHEGNGNWAEPPLRTPAPSWEDSPWSLVSSENNPVLATMRPLGTMPTATDMRKAGLAPARPNTQNIPAKKESQPVLNVNGEKVDDKPQTPLTPAEEQPPIDALFKSAVDFNVDAFMTLPLPSSADVDVEKLQVAVGDALHLASESDNRPVVRGLTRLWEKCGNDPFSLSILDRICQQNPGPREKAVFQSLMREAWKEVQLEEDTGPVVDAALDVARTRSASSISSLSSAKSFDDPATAAGAAKSRARARGKHGRATMRQVRDTDSIVAQSTYPTSAPMPPDQGALEENPKPAEEALNAKKIRLRKSLPRLAPPESRLRSSLAPGIRSNISTPGPASETQLALDGGIVLGRQRLDSVASSDAEDNRRLTPTRDVDTDKDDNENMEENNDYCRECNGSGQLLCCDGCIDSYHFSCLNPPLDPANPPEGDWFCPKCSVSRPMRSLLDRVANSPHEDFSLPMRIRDYFTGVRTSDGGKYEEVIPFPKLNPRGGRGNRTGRYDDPYLLRIHDHKGKLIFCHRCGQTSNGNRPIIQCDYCPCAFHMDCVDPPLAIPPVQKPNSDKPHHNWMCPNHVHHDMFFLVKDEEGYDMVKRIRRPKRPRLIDVEVLPTEEESEALEEHEEQGILYRVSEKGLQLDFIQRVRQENEDVSVKKLAADRYFEYAKQQFDNISAKAHEFYASQRPILPEEDITISVLNSRTVAEREAAANLIAFAQENQITETVEDGKISLLINQLKASAPSLPGPESEIESLRSLQNLIEQRINLLNDQATNENTTQKALSNVQSSPKPTDTDVQPADVSSNGVQPEKE
ncbi:hypothetical protein FE257_001557 [Aspergillus nanangensis]|uniref:PHD-type domain-containing protein n=1 Tax=Aspergillus nanangensis TaxID=2582783 RepID=A0AAD4CTJ0_ASPNN|nr:hypothetical protein FE257_001557 [Aspergillus nanangensis]